MLLTRNGKRGFILPFFHFTSPFDVGRSKNRPPFFVVINMANIIRATTPTIKYTFKTVDVENITSAYMTIMMGDSVLIEKDLVEAAVDEDTIAWTLTQQETLSMTASKITIMLNWKLVDGTRGASARTTLFVEANAKEEVI